MKLSDIIKGTEYDLSLFTEAQITELENRIAAVSYTHLTLPTT